MTRWKVLGMAIVVALIGLFGYGLTKDASLIPSPLVGSPAPEFRLARLDALDSVALSELRGRAVVVNFWASWCLACRQEHASLVRAWRRYRDRGVVMVGVIFQDSKANARAYLAENGGGWTQLVDPKSRMAINYGVYGVPETFFIDADGIVRHKHIGPVSDSLLDTEIEALRERAAPARGAKGGAS